MPLDLKIATPLTLPCGLTLPNRLVKSAMAENMASKDMLPTEQAQHAYAHWAKGGWGMVLTGNVQVDSRYLGSSQDHSLPLDIVPESRLLDAWKAWAIAAGGPDGSTPVVMQLCHPGRQSPVGAGRRGFFAKNIAPSATPLRLQGGCLSAIASALVFGTPREMNQADIDEVVRQFANAARLAAEAGFAGVELHGAHGYLLTQFLTEEVNTRTDAYGGTPTKRAKIVVDIIRAVKAATPEGFCVGIKFNSVDHQSGSAMTACIEQLRVITDAGIDFLEISGGTYDDPTMFQSTLDVGEKSVRTKAREAFFIEFAHAIRGEFPELPLMVTGGFRTRQGIERAVDSGDCELVGLGRPACLNPTLPKSILFNPEINDQDAKLYTKKVETPWLAKHLGPRAVGAGVESMWYSKQIQKMGAS